MKKLLIAAPKSGSGKTILTCGLLELLKRKGIPTASFKCGPDYIDPLFHKRIIGVESRNLDSFFETPEGLKRVFFDSCRGKEEGLALLEGVMGYFDGLAGILPDASTYEIADILDIPVILAVDARGASLSLAALIKGFLEYCPLGGTYGCRENSHIKGVILNRVSPSIYPGLKKTLEKELGIKVAGYIPNLDFLHIESRHLGLILPHEIADLQEQIRKLSDVLEKSLDLEIIFKIAGEGEKESEAGGFKESGRGSEKPPVSFRLGVAKDEAFCFYYHENLKAMEKAGARLIEFSPLHHKELPGDLDGLLIGGGYPELYAGELAKNESMKASIYEASQKGMPIHGECGGYLYLLEYLESPEGVPYPMTGIFKGIGKKGRGLGNFGYITLTAKEDTPFFSKGTKIRGHEFHYWQTAAMENGQGTSRNCRSKTQMEAEKPVSSKSWQAMEQKENTLAGFPHFYYPSCPEFTENFAAACLKFQLAGRTLVKRRFHN